MISGKSRFLAINSCRTKQLGLRIKMLCKELHWTVYSIFCDSSRNINKSLIPCLYLSFSSNSYFFNISQISFYSQPACLCYCFPPSPAALTGFSLLFFLIAPPLLLKYLLIISDTFSFTYGNSAQFGVSFFFFLIFPYSCSSAPLLPFPWANLPPDISWLCFSARSLLRETFLTSNPHVWLQCYPISFYFSLHRESHGGALSLQRPGKYETVTVNRAPAFSASGWKSKLIHSFLMDHVFSHHSCSLKFQSISWNKILHSE